EHCDNDRFSIGVEVATSCSTGISKAEAIGAQGDVGTWDVWTNLLVQVSHEVRDTNEWAIDGFQLGGYEWLFWLHAVLQRLLVQALAIACQLNPRGYGEEVGLHTVVLIQDLLRTQRLVHTDTGGQDIRLEVGVAHGVELVDTAVQAFYVQVLWLSWLVYWLVVHGEVVHVVFRLFAVHTVNTTGNQVCDFEAERRVILQDSWVGGRQNRGVAIHVLQTLTGKRGAACGSTDDKATCHLVSCCPQGITRALETEHRVE